VTAGNRRAHGPRSGVTRYEYLVDGWRSVSKNVDCPTRDADRTVVHVASPVERSTATGTSALDHVTRIDWQSAATADTPSVVDVVLLQIPAGQTSQTLGNGLRYERPPLGACATQARALRRIAHVVVPSGFVRQHVT